MVNLTGSAFAALLHARRIGKGKWVARCPSHDDRRPSLSIAEGRKGVLIRCMSFGCETRDILGALGLKFSDLFYDESHIDPEIIRQIRAVEAKREAQKEYRTKLLWLARKRIEFWHRKSQVLGRSLYKWPDQDKLAKDFHYAITMERRCQDIWQNL